MIPDLYTWDAIVSHWRTYSVEELLGLTAGIEGYVWEGGRLPPDAPRGWISYLVGIPAA